jgi:hypothetical protein
VIAAGSFLLLALLLRPGVDLGTGPASDVARILLRPSKDGQEEDVVRDLARLGAPAVPTLVLCATGDVFSVLSPDDIGDGVSLAVRPDRFGLAAEAALGAMNPSVVVAGLKTHLVSDRSLAGRMAAARVLGRVASTEGLELALVLLRATSPEELGAPYVRQPLRDAIAAPLRAHSEALQKLESALAELDQPRLAVVIEALAEGERGDAAQLLIDLLRTDPELTSAILGALGTVTGRRPFEVEADIEGVLVRLLQDPDPAKRAGAARAAGEGAQAGVAWALIERLADESVEVRSAARSALRSLAEVDHGYDAGAWSFLVEREARFVEGDGLDTLIGEITGEDLAAAASALRQVGEHALLRAELGRRIGDALCGLSPQAARAAASALQNLGARTAIPGLVSLLACTPDDGVRQAAGEALTTLSGADLTSEQTAWRAWLGRR